MGPSGSHQFSLRLKYEMNSPRYGRSSTPERAQISLCTVSPSSRPSLPLQLAPTLPPPGAIARTIMLYGMGPISICEVEGSPPSPPARSRPVSESASWPMMSSWMGISSMTHRRHTEVACGLDSCVPELLQRGHY
jgi:hypothetical protein